MKKMKLDSYPTGQKGSVWLTLRIYSGNLAKGDFVEDCADQLEHIVGAGNSLGLRFIEDYNRGVKSRVIYTRDLKGERCPDENNLPSWIITAVLEIPVSTVVTLPKLIEEASTEYGITLCQLFVEGRDKAIAAYVYPSKWQDIFAPLSENPAISEWYRKLCAADCDAPASYEFCWAPDWSMERLLGQGGTTSTSADLHSLTKELTDVLEKINAVRPVQFLGFEDECTYNFVRLHESAKDDRIYIEISTDYDNLPAHIKAPILSVSGHPIPSGFRWIDPVSD